jgi:Tfp pilus assembly protein PilP
MMARLRNGYYIGFLSALLVLVISNAAPAEPEKIQDKNIKPPEATSEPVKDATANSQAGYLYDPTNKTDPFKSFLAVREEQAKSKAKTYLETLELSQLDLTVTVVGSKGKWAMLKDSKGVGHVIKEGTPIGTNNGVVFKISQGEIVIREQHKDFRGQVQNVDITKVTQSQ